MDEIITHTKDEQAYYETIEPILRVELSRDEDGIAGVQSLCQCWRISESTFYRIMKKFKERYREVVQ